MLSIYYKFTKSVTSFIQPFYSKCIILTINVPIEKNEFFSGFGDEDSLQDIQANIGMFTIVFVSSDAIIFMDIFGGIFPFLQNFKSLSIFITTFFLLKSIPFFAEAFQKEKNINIHFTYKPFISFSFFLAFLIQLYLFDLCDDKDYYSYHYKINKKCSGAH